jgi:hypothetical protein
MAVPEQTGRKTWIRSLIAWVGTAALLAYLGATTDLDQAWRALRLADMVIFPGVIVGMTLLTWLTDAAIARQVLARSGFDVTLGEFVRIKGASYLLNIVNYNLGLVLMAAVVTRRSDRGWKAAGSPFILLNFIDLSAMGILVAVGLAVAGSPFSAEPTALLAVAAAGGLLGAPVLCALARARSAPPWLDRLLRNDLLAAFRTLRARDLAAFTSLRVVFIAEYIVMTWAMLKCFRFTIPLFDVFVYNPIVGLIGFIPISVSGLGTTQVVSREFYAPFAPIGVDGIAAVDAYSTASILAVLLVRILIALACLPSVTRSARAPVGQ